MSSVCFVQVRFAKGVIFRGESRQTVSQSALLFGETVSVEGDLLSCLLYTLRLKFSPESFQLLFAFR